MSQATVTTSSERKRSAQPPSEQKAKCALIMPISATSSHDETHWKNVLKLLHRAIESAGFDPVNVWESSTGDRISERIIGNIFNLDIAVADISDLNPNVMFELGLRLSSKKPTIVVCESGGIVPFDIRDFEILFYPSDLNILDMEDFFSKLDKHLKDKFSSFNSDTYSAFLASVVVDVASPQTREVGFSDMILSRLEDLNRKISALDNRPTPSQIITRNRPKSILDRSYIYVEIPSEKSEEFIERANSLYDVDGIIEVSNRNGIRELKVDFSSANTLKSKSSILSLAFELGGEEGLPF